MSEENKIIVEEKCFCKSKFFRHFAAITLGTFVGGFCALNLFAALNKPPMMPMGPMMGGSMMGHHMMAPMGGHHFKKHGCDCPCHKKMMKKMMEDKVKLQKEIEQDKD